MIWYCRRCDLGFCAFHSDQHPDYAGHELSLEWPDNARPFCAVCTGLYSPPPVRREHSD